MHEQKSKLGLNDSNRAFITTIVFFGLLFWGPQNDGTFFIAGGIAIMVWMFLKYVGKNWLLGKVENDRINRALAALLAASLFIGAYQSYSSPTHTECTNTVNTRDGQECVGDYVTVEGGDRGGALLQVIFGGVAFWYAISDHDENE